MKEGWRHEKRMKRNAMMRIAFLASILASSGAVRLFVMQSPVSEAARFLAFYRDNHRFLFQSRYIVKSYRS